MGRQNQRVVFPKTGFFYAVPVKHRRLLSNNKLNNDNIDHMVTSNGHCPAMGKKYAALSKYLILLVIHIFHFFIDLWPVVWDKIFYGQL